MKVKVPKKSSSLLVCFLFLLFSPYAFAQEEIENGKAYDPVHVNPLLNHLYQKNGLVIAFRTSISGRTEHDKNYFILSRNGNKNIAYSFNQQRDSLINLNLTDDDLNLIWKTFIQNDLFKMKNEADNLNFCPEKYHIFNSFTYEFIILSKGQMKMLSYYDPEHYDQYCYGMPERKKIINCVSVINYTTANKS